VEIRDYIESGVIESYVLGLAEPEEVADLETLKEQHPEIQQAIDDFTTSLEEHAFKNAIAPPPEVKARLMANLANDDLEMQGVNPLTVAYNRNDEHSPQAPVRRMRTWSFAAAAAVVLLIVSAAGNIFLYNKYSNTKSQYQVLLTERSSLQASNQVFQAKIRDYQSAAEMMADPTVVMVKMSDPNKKQNNMTTVFWDSKTKDVYLMANKLPVPSASKQYQLWALVDGKPVDAGMLDPNCTSVCKMKNIPRAQAFAITLENAGGSPAPTMSQLYVLGNV
jgi:anti-sigma-K factor RskA